MSDQDLFNEKDEKKDETTQDQGKPQEKKTDDGTNQYASMLGMIVNENGEPKYRTIEDAIKGAAHAQEHIRRLESELSEVRKGSESAKKIEDLIASLQSKGNDGASDGGENENKNVPTFNPEDISKIVEQTLENKSKQATQEQNVKTVTSKFRELYGDKASETLYGKAEDLGFDREGINSLIASNPKAAMKLLGVEEGKKESFQPANSSVNTEAFSGKREAERKSSMGFVSNKELASNWLATKQKTLERLGIQNN